MRNLKIQDEREIVQRRKVNSEAYGILMIILFVSVLVQQFLLKAPFEQYAVEVICLLGMAIYMTIRYITLGLNVYGHGEGKESNLLPLVISITTGIIVTAINGVLNYMEYANHYTGNFGYFVATLIVTFISATFFTFIILSYLTYLNRKKQYKIQQQLDENENEK